MPVRAAVLHTPGQPLTIEDIELAPTGPDQVRVRLAATGVCHSDLSLARGALRQPVPAVLGHEGAGIVAEVGSAVTKVRPGDPVILCWSPPCRECFFCARGEPHLCERAVSDPAAAPYATLRGTPLHAGLATGAFATETLVLERAVVPVDRAVPLEVAALVGCAVMTGVGAVLNTARVPAGASVAVIGCGGVGLSVVQGARYAGASRIVAVDRTAAKLDLAADVGATDVLSADADVVAEIRGLTAGHGADYVFEAIGAAETIRLAWRATRRGGTTVVVGVGRRDDPVCFSALELFHSGRSLLGCVYGSTDPDRDFPRLVSLYQSGDLALDRLITDRVSLDQVGAALAAMESGTGARSVVTFD